MNKKSNKVSAFVACTPTINHGIIAITHKHAHRMKTEEEEVSSQKADTKNEKEESNEFYALK